jgi:hypothetical protein
MKKCMVIQVTAKDEGGYGNGEYRVKRLHSVLPPMYEANVAGRWYEISSICDEAKVPVVGGIYTVVEYESDWSGETSEKETLSTLFDLSSFERLLVVDVWKPTVRFITDNNYKLLALDDEIKLMCSIDAASFSQLKACFHLSDDEKQLLKDYHNSQNTQPFSYKHWTSSCYNVYHNIDLPNHFVTDVKREQFTNAEDTIVLLGKRYKLTPVND